MYLKYSLCFFAFLFVGAVRSKGIELPNVSGISRELTGNLTVDQFFSLWIVFNEDDVQISGKSPFEKVKANVENKKKKNINLSLKKFLNILLALLKLSLTELALIRKENIYFPKYLRRN